MQIIICLIAMVFIIPSQTPNNNVCSKEMKAFPFLLKAFIFLSYISFIFFKMVSIIKIKAFKENKKKGRAWELGLPVCVSLWEGVVQYLSEWSLD